MGVLFFLYIITFNFNLSQDIEELLESRQYVLEANRVKDDKNSATSISKRLSFIRIKSSEIIIQWTANMDNNGLGGITIRGKIRKYDVSEISNDKETQYVVEMKCSMDDGRVESDIQIEIFSKSHAVAILKNVTSSYIVPENMEFRGNIVPLEESRIELGIY